MLARAGLLSFDDAMSIGNRLSSSISNGELASQLESATNLVLVNISVSVINTSQIILLQQPPFPPSQQPTPSPSTPSGYTSTSSWASEHIGMPFVSF